MKEKPQFSYFKEPVRNVMPYKTINFADVHRALTSDFLKECTNQLRLISGKEENRKFKSTHFPYVTFSGTFSKRNEKALIEHSGLIAIDIDHLEDVDAVKQQLLKDPHFETQLLFTSPNGNGIKWIINIQISEQFPHGKMFQAIFNYIKQTYSIEIDKACKDVSRATFLCHDPDAFIHPKHLIK